MPIVIGGNRENTYLALSTLQVQSSQLILYQPTYCQTGTARPAQANEQIHRQGYCGPLPRRLVAHIVSASETNASKPTIAIFSVGVSSSSLAIVRGGNPKQSWWGGYVIATPRQVGMRNDIKGVDWDLFPSERGGIP